LEGVHARAKRARVRDAPLTRVLDGLGILGFLLHPIELQGEAKKTMLNHWLQFPYRSPKGIAVVVNSPSLQLRDLGNKCTNVLS
jgi:hypothetical protein